MRRLLGIVALLLLISGAAPVLACVSAGTTNRQQSACCGAKQSKCETTAKMSCCRTDIRTNGQPQMDVTGPSSGHVLVTAQWLAAAVISPRSVPSSVLDGPAEHSPPGLLGTRTTVLRV